MKTVLLALTLCMGASDNLAASDNLDFRSGDLHGWQGEGFELLAGSDPGVSSKEPASTGRSALLHRLFQVPHRAGVLRFRAVAVHPEGTPPSRGLDVILLAAGRRLVPKQIRGQEGWRPVGTVAAGKSGSWQEYQWDLRSWGGHTLRLALVDEDARPGYHLECSGFSWLPQDELEAREFSQFMLQLVRDHRLTPVLRYDSAHFTALSNADDILTESNLHNCELIYVLFIDHFRRKGFRVTAPPAKLMVAMFDSPAGLDAYLGHRASQVAGGVYDKRTNRLIVYDQGQHQAFLRLRQQLGQRGRTIKLQVHRLQFQQAVERWAEELRKTGNISTMMHEVAHHLSFNCGLLNRDGDAPLWLVEGLACYCEATREGTWEGIGEINYNRLQPLAQVLAQGERLLPLKELLAGDDWLRQAQSLHQLELGYAQSWALFYLLMEEHPAPLQRYLATIYSRQTPEHRLADFTEAFGRSLPRFEARYHEFVRDLVNTHVRLLR